MERRRWIVAALVLAAWLPPLALSAYVDTISVPAALHPAAMLVLGWIFGRELRDRLKDDPPDDPSA